MGNAVLFQRHAWSISSMWLHIMVNCCYAQWYSYSCFYDNIELRLVAAHLVYASILMVIWLLQMDGVPGQLPGRRIDDYLSTLSEEASLSNDQPDGSAKANSNMRLEDISLI